VAIAARATSILGARENRPHHRARGLRACSPWLITRSCRCRAPTGPFQTPETFRKRCSAPPHALNRAAAVRWSRRTGTANIGGGTIGTRPRSTMSWVRRSMGSRTIWTAPRHFTQCLCRATAFPARDWRSGWDRPGSFLQGTGSPSAASVRRLTRDSSIRCCAGGWKQRLRARSAPRPAVVRAACHFVGSTIIRPLSEITQPTPGR